MTKIKAVFNWSGGKDFAQALLRAMESGCYEIIALLTTVNRLAVGRLLIWQKLFPPVFC